MTLREKRALILLGGQWHDFDGFAQAMQTLLKPLGMHIDATYDLDHLLRLEKDHYDLVLGYTCLSTRQDGNNPTGPERLTDTQIAGLAGWVRSGGAFLALHAATVTGESNPALGNLIGGVFVSHPPQFSFTIYPMFEEHPITAGVEAFTVRDEFYIETCTPDVRVHMVALDRGVAHPMVWSKTEGQGRVAHIAPGHSQVVWNCEPYQRLLLQTIAWLLLK